MSHNCREAFIPGVFWRPQAPMYLCTATTLQVHQIHDMNGGAVFVETLAQKVKFCNLLSTNQSVNTEGRVANVGM